MTDDLVVRRGTGTDLSDVLDVLGRALGWTDEDATFLEWKHLQNPFGASPMWLMLDRERIVGFRAFMRWEFTARDGHTIPAARAVDTATDPDYQGRGVFTRLTLSALDEMSADGIELVFNTPNDKSLPGYLKMGWCEVGHLGVAVKPTSARFPLVVGTARGPAGRRPFPSTLGHSPAEIFAMRGGIDELLAAVPRVAGISTRRTADYMSWRYGHEPLGYRVLLRRAGSPEHGMAVFRLRRRGRALECVLCELLVPDGPERFRTESDLIRRIGRASDADYLVRLDQRRVTRGPFVRLPASLGPVLACRPLDASPAPDLASWGLTMGDVELF